MAAVILNPSSSPEVYGVEEPPREVKVTFDSMMEAPRHRLFEFAGRLVEEKVIDSGVFDPTIDSMIPRFDDHEVRLGRILGRGGFCVVAEIDKVKISGMPRSGSSIGSTRFGGFFKKSNYDDIDQNSNYDGSEKYATSEKSAEKSDIGDGSRPRLSRVALATLSRKKTKSGSRFALKRVNPELQHYNKLNFLKGIVDLAMEAKFLANLDHPNVIALCGISKMGAADFIIIERLNQTLSSKFKDWMNIDRQCKGITGFFVGSKRKIRELNENRYKVAHDIALACGYLHQRNIVFRDLKPDNIGFDASGTVKLFDFGLAKELKKKDCDEDGLYKLTGLTGALRYMAPEVGRGKPYNLSADVYSWSMIMWFILALEPPFGYYTEAMIMDRVFQRGSRPAIFDAWPPSISDLMRRAWSVKISNRPTFAEITSTIKLEMIANDSTGTSCASVSATSDPAL